MIVIEQIDKIKNIYDLFALCLSYLMKKNKETNINFPELELIEKVEHVIDNYYINLDQLSARGALNILKRKIKEFLMPETTIEKCYSIVKSIDGREYTCDEGTMEKYEIIKYTALNKQYTDKIRILPILSNTFMKKADSKFKKTNKNTLFRKRYPVASSNLDREISNYILLDEDVILRYPITIHRINKNNPLYEQFGNKQKLNIAVVPFTKLSLEKILSIKYQSRAFFIEKMKEDAENMLIDVVASTYERLRDKDIDILIYPEMLMTDNIMKEISEQKAAKIIANGSIWENRVNKTIVTDMSCNEILSYCKKEPFIYKDDETDKEYTESLDGNRNKGYNILEIEGFGRIGFCICKDLLQEGIKQFHRIMDTNLLIVPAYTGSMDLKKSAEGLSSEYNCIVVVANACSALYKTEECCKQKTVGFITIPAKKGTSRESVTLDYGNSRCIGECQNSCIPKYINIDFDNICNIEDKLTFKVSIDQ